MKVFEHLRYKSSKTVTGLNCSNRDGDVCCLSCALFEREESVALNDLFLCFYMSHSVL